MQQRPMISAIAIDEQIPRRKVAAETGAGVFEFLRYREWRPTSSATLRPDRKLREAPADIGGRAHRRDNLRRGKDGENERRDEQPWP